ncbi:hypothetical protein SAMN05444920_13838 [Nonomuraea solani]|uniref:Uncharacterized protein n=2 Tax=Nonomuraea solani TaxID=1144553 RepID=A0A1H6F3A3_9ACTN|nr:hypothetical protein SAMN05444920_13838 [Nonomuraea solani]
MGLGLLVNVGLFGWIGAADLSGAMSFTGRVTGVALVVVALVMFIAALAAYNYQGTRRLEYSGALAMFGYALVFIANALMLILQYQGRDITLSLGAWFALLVWSGWALWKLYRQGAWHGLLHPRRFAAGVTATAVLAAGNFAYTQMYLPHMSPTKINFSTRLDKPVAHPNGDSVYLPLTISIRNDGTSEIYAVGVVYWIWGAIQEYTPQARTVMHWAKDLRRLGDQHLYRFADLRKLELLATGINHVPPGSPLSPGAVTAIEKIVMLPKDRQYDIVEAKAQLIVARKDRLGVDAPSKPSYVTSSADSGRERPPSWVLKGWQKNTQFIKYNMRIKQPSKLLELTRAEKRITVWVLIGSIKADPASPYVVFNWMIVTNGEESHKPTDKDKSLEVAQYGLTDIGATSSATSLVTETTQHD